MKYMSQRISCLISILFITNFLYSQDTLNIKLSKAVIVNNKEDVKKLVAEGANINYVDSNGASILMWAAYKADIDLFIWLRSKGGKLESKGVIYLDTLKSYYGSLLCIASGEGNAALLKYLIEDCKLNINEREYNPTSKQNDGWLPITWAVSHNHLDIIEVLIKNGANIRTEPNLLQIAKNSNHLKISRYLQQKGLKLITEKDFKTILPTAPASLINLYATDNKKYLIGYGFQGGAFHIWDSKTLQLIQIFPVSEFVITSCFNEKDNAIYYIGVNTKDSTVNIYSYDLSFKKKFLISSFIKADEFEKDYSEDGEDLMSLMIIFANDRLFFAKKRSLYVYSLLEKRVDTVIVAESNIKTIIPQKFSNILVLVQVDKITQIDVNTLKRTAQAFNVTGTQVKKIISFNDDNNIGILENCRISILNKELSLDYQIPIDSTLKFELFEAIDSNFLLFSKEKIQLVGKKGEKKDVFDKSSAIDDFIKNRSFAPFSLVKLDNDNVCFIASYALGIIYKLKLSTGSVLKNNDEISIGTTYHFNKSKEYILKDNSNLYSLYNMHEIMIPGIKKPNIQSLNREIFAAYDTSIIRFFEIKYSQCDILETLNLANTSIVERVYGSWDCVIYTNSGEFFVYKLLGNKLKKLFINMGTASGVKKLFHGKENQIYLVDSSGRIFLHSILPEIEGNPISVTSSEIIIPQKVVDIDISSNLIVISDTSNFVYVYKHSTGKLYKVWEPRFALDLIQNIKIAHSGDFIILSTGLFSNRIIVIDLIKSDVYSKTMEKPIQGIDIFDSTILVSSISGLCIGLNVHSLKNEFEFCTTYGNEILSMKGNYFTTSSKRLNKLIGYTNNNLDHVTFDQLDIKYNRPDKVLEAIGSTDTALINSYKKAYLKRIKKLGIDTTSFKEGFTIPEADFKNRDAVEYEQKSKQLKLYIAGKSTEALDRFNVWINEVPLYGQKGISLRYKNKKNIDTTLSVVLSEGDNSIETSITDVNGIESYRQPLFVKYSPEKKQPSKTYFIGIGINRFADNMNNLSWSVKDIRDLAIKFASKSAVIDTLFDENVTTEKISALKNKLLQTNEEDKVIISYSGHGLLSKEYDYFLSTYNINFRKPEQNGLPYEVLENLLDGIKARKKLLLIDACHSGEVDKEEMKNYEDSKDSRKKEGVKGLIIAPKDSTKVGMRNSFEMMQELFVNVGRGTGATVISAASGTQFALEKGDLRNGVFTYCLLEAMNNNSTLKVSDLKKAVTDKVPKLTAGLQKPTFRSETQQFDWELW